MIVQLSHSSGGVVAKLPAAVCTHRLANIAGIASQLPALHDQSSYIQVDSPVLML